MDRLPLIPKNENDHDQLFLLTDIFQDVLRYPQYPKNVAENYKKYQVDLEFKEVQQTGINTIKVLEALDTSREDITNVEKEILQSYAQAIIKKHDYAPILEELKLKRLQLFKKLSNQACETYELITTSDFYPNYTLQSLDFTYNPFLHTCSQPCLEKEEKKVEILPVKPSKIKHQSVEPPPPAPPFKIEPNQLIFHNYELNKLYKEKIKLRNITNTPQMFQFWEFPRTSPFRLKLLSPSCLVAPGMFAEFLLTFKTQTYKNNHETVKIKTMTGVDVILVVINSRDSPKLVCYVLNPLLPWDTVNKPGPGSRYFLDRRQDALNFTIDCGTCLFGSYALISVIMKNEGPKGRFFITTEEEWAFNEITDGGARPYELIRGGFFIFPAFFELESNEIGEILVLFIPEKVGIFTEKLYVICDNNSHQEIELLGDSVKFSSSFLKVNMYLLEDTFSYQTHVLGIDLIPYEKYSFLFSIRNNSPVCLEYYWALASDNKENRCKKMDADWIHITSTPYLPTFSTTDILVELTPKTEEEGTYYIYLSLCLKNIPIESVECGTFLKYGPDDEFVFLPLVEGTEDPNDPNRKLVHVHIFELRIFCTVKKPDPPSIVVECRNTREPEPEVVPRKQNLALSTTMVDFGDIPKGVAISKSFRIKNLTKDNVDWMILEICRQESSLVLLSPSKTLSLSCGILKGFATQKIVYTIEAKECQHRFSVLILFSSCAAIGRKYTAEAICVVTYQVSDIKITIRAANNTTVLCPSYVHVGLPSLQKIYVHNEGTVTGCFYFLKPTGSNSDKVRIRMQPQSSVVPPGTTIEVCVEIVGLESGVFEDIYVPCFTGDPDKLVSLAVILSVSGISAHFYLPNDNGFKRILWPPNERSSWTTVSYVGEDWQSAEGEWSQPQPTVDLDESLMGLIGGNSVASTYPTIRVKPLEIKESAKLTFHMENLTPIHGRYLVSPTNYSPEEECFHHTLVKAKRRPPEFFWEKACCDGYGIVIEAERISGDIVPYEVVEIVLWIYANTWGLFLEEMIVEINDLTPFCFNLIVEVVGLPLEFPFARNTTLPVPTLRFGYVPYCTDTSSQSFTVTNISAIPVEISWYVFVPPPDHHESNFNILVNFNQDYPEFVIPDTFYGYRANSQCVSVTPSELVLEKQSTVTVTVTIAPNSYQPNYEKTHLKFDLVGFIGLSDKDKFKENYFKRDCGMDSPCAKLTMLVTLELPIMQVELLCDDTTLNVFVNDILLKNYKIPQIYLCLRNVDKSTVRFRLEMDKPFQVSQARTVPTDILDTQNLSLARNECLQIMVTCHISGDDLSKFADILYQRNDEDDDANFICVISRDLKVCQQNAHQQVIPFQIRLHFPHIKVKPQFLRIMACLLYRTRKAIFSIYNLTGSVVEFEVFKSNKQELEVFPNSGKIPGSTGVNKQFIDVAVYFTPRHCKLYVESLRVLTNIPQYYIDVPITATGTNNEKFNPD